MQIVTLKPLFHSGIQSIATCYWKPGLPANISIHSLRHSYATHLLVNGTGIRFIQGLPGTTNINTTLRYTHVSKKELSKIESPLDKIMRKHQQE